MSPDENREPSGAAFLFAAPSLSSTVLQREKCQPIRQPASCRRDFPPVQTIATKSSERLNANRFEIAPRVVHEQRLVLRRAIRAVHVRKVAGFAPATALRFLQCIQSRQMSVG